MFRKDFYIEVPELAKMSDAEVEEYRQEMEGIKVDRWELKVPKRNKNLFVGERKKCSEANQELAPVWSELQDIEHVEETDIRKANTNPGRK